MVFIKYKPPETSASIQRASNNSFKAGHTENSITTVCYVKIKVTINFSSLTGVAAVILSLGVISLGVLFISFKFLSDLMCQFSRSTTNAPVKLLQKSC